MVPAPSGVRRPHGCESPSPDDWRAELDAYGRDYLSLGAAEVQRRLSSDLVVVQQQLEIPGMWEVASRLMTLYGKTSPGSDGAKAIHWYRKAVTAVDRSGDDASRVWVRGRAAIALGYEGSCPPVAAIRGERRTALRLLADGLRVFDAAGSDEQESDYAVPEWRMAVFCSLLLARLGDERGAVEAQDAALKTLPASLPRFATHLELHRGLMLARAGDHAGGEALARAMR